MRNLIENLDKTNENWQYGSKLAEVEKKKKINFEIEKWRDNLRRLRRLLVYCLRFDCQKNKNKKGEPHFFVN